MTIEAGPKPNGVRPATADARNQKNKSAAMEGPGGGFGAILASLDASDAMDQAVLEPGDAQGNANLSKGAPPTVTPGFEASAKDLGQAVASSTRRVGKGMVDFEIVEPIVSVEPVDGKGLGLKDPSEAVALMLPAADTVAVSPQGPLDAAALLSQSAQWSTVPVQSIQPDSQKAIEGFPQLASASAKSSPLLAKSDGLGLGPSLAPESLTEAVGKADKLTRGTAAKSEQPVPLAVATQPVEATESRLQLLSEKTIIQNPIAALAMPLATANTMAPTRREDQARDRFAIRSDVTEGSALGQSLVSTVPITSVQYTAELQTSPELFVAEKVAYWISNDVQNAEMKLDGIGLDPVEVSIRMHGNEAHVAFRTDELQARAALENASTHLKELLQREGLVLTGVSVGTAGTGDSSGKNGKSSQDGRQSTVASVTAVRADRGGVAGRIAGGTLDLFV